MYILIFGKLTITLVNYRLFVILHLIFPIASYTISRYLIKCLLFYCYTVERLSGGDLYLVEKVLNVQKDIRTWSSDLYVKNHFFPIM